jgi:flagellar basal body-associated protein FliL
MAKKSMPRKNSRSKRWLWIGILVGTIISAAAVSFVAANVFKSPTPSASTSDIAANLPRSDSAFNVGTRIGQPAPAFTLPDAQGQSYAFNPGDGRKYVLAFNMGFVRDLCKQ